MLPKPYYDCDGITIYLGDCREILPYLPKVDLVLTDPPYGISFQSNCRNVKHDKIKGDEQLPLDLIYLSIFKAMNAAYFFCRWDNLKQMPPPKSVLAWVKNNWTMGDLQHEHGRQWEACCFYPKEKHAFTKRIPDVIMVDKTGNVLHPTEKPVELMKIIISANVCQSILDPFMGSGTTLVAAKHLHRKAIGIEIEQRYCDIAIKRLSQGVLDFSTESNSRGALSDEKPSPSLGDKNHTGQLSLLDNEHRRGVENI